MTTSADRRALFREVNARIRDINDAFDTDLDSYLLLCECGGEGCVERVKVPISVYESALREAHRFVVVPGHEQTADRVAGVAVDYLIVSAPQASVTRGAGCTLDLAGAELRADA